MYYFRRQFRFIKFPRVVSLGEAGSWKKKSEDNGAGGWGVVLKSRVTCEINIFIRVILRKCFSRPLYGDIQFLLLALRQKIHIYRISLGQLKHYNYD